MEKDMAKAEGGISHPLRAIANDIGMLFTSKLFLAVLAIKIVAGIFLASSFPTDYFIPFIKQFVTDPATSPYTHFVSAGFIDAFPYPPLMLGLLSLPFIPAALAGITTIGSTTVLDLFLLRLPLIAADIVLLLLLYRLLPDKKKELLTFYWCSPILFYISYVHGQLDIIPIVFLFASLALLFWKHPFARPLSFAVFGAGLATKTNILLAFPFMLLYVWKQRRSIKEVAFLTIISGIAFAAFTLPFLNEGFIRMVFLSEQQGGLFSFVFPLGASLVLYIAPITYFALFFRFAAYKKLNPDAMMMIMSLVFSIFMVLVPPHPGWFFWGIPFMIYFFVRLDTVRRFTYWALNAAYFLFFITWKQSDIPGVLQLVSPQLASTVNMYTIMVNAGLPADVLSSIAFSILAATTIMVAYWIYRRGISANEDYFIRSRPVSIGIGGDSGSGKTTLAAILTDTFGEMNTLIVNGDDMHKWERHNEQWKHKTHLNPASNRLHLDYNQAMQLLKGRQVQRSFYDHSTGTFTPPTIIVPRKTILFVGLHPFYIKGMREMQDLKIFLDPDERIQKHWKIARDTTERAYTTKDTLNAITRRNPDRKKHILPQKRFADMVVSFRIAEPPLPGKEVVRESLAMSIRLDNSIDAERIIEVLSDVKTMNVHHEYDEDCEYQTLEFKGTMRAETIRDVTASVAPQYMTIIDHEPIWHDNYAGVLQMVTLFHLNETMKNRGPSYE